MAFLDGRRPPPKPRPPPPQQQQQEGDGEQQQQQQQQPADEEAGGPGCAYYSPEDLGSVKRDLEGLAGDVDLLLTCEWPEGVLGALPADQAAVPGAGLWVVGFGFRVGD